MAKKIKCEGKMHEKNEKKMERKMGKKVSRSGAPKMKYKKK